MAFIEKTKSGYCVKQGNTGKTIRCYTGKDAKKKAEDDMKRLHKRFNPSSANRGKRAQNAVEKRMKDKKKK